ncbi:MAG: tetratricopeptide repeat protein [Patescibacteria group bacterium]
MASADGSAEKMPKLSNFLQWVIEIALRLGIFITPLFFLPITLDVLELNKQSLFAVIVLVALTAWLGKALADRKFFLGRSWFNIVVLLFTGGWLVTSLFSKDLYLSLVGNFGQMQWSFLTIAMFVAFYFLVVNNVFNTKQLYCYVLTFLLSSVFVGIYGILQLTGIHAFGFFAPFTEVNTFNTIGTINALGVFMSIPLVLAASLTVFGCKDGECTLGQKAKASVMKNTIVWSAMIISLVVLILIDFWVAWAGALFGLVLLAVIPLVRSTNISHPARIAVPIVLGIISILLLIFKTPINLNLPAEVSPSAAASWSIAKSVLRENPIFGSGPGTWIYDYAKYRSPAVNLSQFWTIRFERGLTAFFSLIAMTGLVGVLLWLMLVISSVVKSARTLFTEKDDDEWQAYLTIFTGWMTIAFIAFIYNYNFAHHFIFWLLTALLVSLITKKAYVWQAKKGSAGSVIISVLFICLSVGAMSFAWLAGQRLAADAAYSKAVIGYREGKPIDQGIEHLNRAVAMNRWNDVYYRNLSQAYLIKAGQEFEVLKNDPQGAATINQIIAASIDTGKKAAEINPMNVDNWENLAIIYQSIASFTQGADEFAINNFKEALDREPNNPVYSNEIGKLHIMRADAFTTLLQASDEQARAEAEQKIKAELDQAAEWLNRAIQAKPDFAPAHYYLGLVYERQGRIQDAITKLEQVLSVNQNDVGIAFQLAILYYRNDNKDQSLATFEKIVQIAPQYANARWYLSAIYEEQGRLAEALEQVRIIEQTNADNPNVSERIAYLQSLQSAENTPPPAAELPPPVEEQISSPEEQNPIQGDPLPE